MEPKVMEVDGSDGFPFQFFMDFYRDIEHDALAKEPRKKTSLYTLHEILVV